MKPAMKYIENTIRLNIWQKNPWIKWTHGDKRRIWVLVKMLVVYRNLNYVLLNIGVSKIRSCTGHYR